MVITLNLAKVIITKDYTINHEAECQWANRDMELGIFLNIYIIWTTFLGNLCDI